jgi:hypothetical protein
VYVPAVDGLECWGDVVVSLGDVLEGKISGARYVLVDVGLESLIRRFGGVDYPRFWLDQYFAVVRGLEGLKPGRVWAVVPDYPHRWSGARIDHYFLRHWRIFFKLWPELEDYYMPVIRFEGLGLWELGMMLDSLKQFLRDFEALGVPSRLSVGPNPLWMAKVYKVREAFPDHWIHGLGAGFSRARFLAPGLLDSMDFRLTFTHMPSLRNMARIYLGMEGLWGRGPQNSGPRVHDYKSLRRALLEVLIMILEERVGGIDYAWRQG